VSPGLTVLCRYCCTPQILSAVAQLTEQEWQYTLTASCIEVYNNQLRCVRRLWACASLAWNPVARRACTQPVCSRNSQPPPVTHAHAHTTTTTTTTPHRDLLAEASGGRSADAGRVTDPNAIKHDAAGGHTFVQVGCVRTLSGLVCCLAVCGAAVGLC
jgi:hypothetical protein